LVLRFAAFFFGGSFPSGLCGVGGVASSFRKIASSFFPLSEVGMTKNPEIIYDFDPHNLPPELLRAIGLVVAASAQTESIVQQFIGCLLGIDQAETIALTAHIPHPLKDHIARALIELNAANAAVVDDVDDLLDAIKAAFEKRNVVVHNSLARNPETGEVLSLRESAHGSLQVSLTPIRFEEVEKDAALIYKVGIDLMGFMMDRGLEPAPRTRPIRAPLNRKQKMRLARRNHGGPR
jgi:hypothetical protein